MVPVMVCDASAFTAVPSIPTASLVVVLRVTQTVVGVVQIPSAVPMLMGAWVTTFGAWVQTVKDRTSYGNVQVKYARAFAAVTPVPTTALVVVIRIAFAVACQAGKPGAVWVVFQVRLAPSAIAKQDKNAEAGVAEPTHFVWRFEIASQLTQTPPNRAGTVEARGGQEEL